MQPPKPYREERPWGEFIEFTKNTPCTVKILTVNPGEAFSLQTHENRDEFWRVLCGNGKVTHGDAVTPADIGQEYYMPRGTKHRLEAGSETLNVLEISFGTFDDNDITRIEDKYGRAGPPNN